ncbi:MAG: TfoX/Sxy family protein [Pseudomonadota bacterium]
MATSKNEFADYCCELLSVVGPCRARRMFGGFGISTDGLTFALVADLGGGEVLWLKADADTRAQFEAAGCQRFSYSMNRNGRQAMHSLNYYSAPEEAMESQHLMLPWARLSLQSALKARPVPKTRAAPAVKKKAVAKPAKKPAAKKGKLA